MRRANRQFAMLVNWALVAFGAFCVPLAIYHGKPGIALLALPAIAVGVGVILLLRRVTVAEDWPGLDPRRQHPRSEQAT